MSRRGRPTPVRGGGDRTGRWWWWWWRGGRKVGQDHAGACHECARRAWRPETGAAAPWRGRPRRPRTAAMRAARRRLPRSRDPVSLRITRRPKRQRRATRSLWRPDGCHVFRSGAVAAPPRVPLTEPRQARAPAGGARAPRRARPPSPSAPWRHADPPRAPTPRRSGAVGEARGFLRAVRGAVGDPPGAVGVPPPAAVAPAPRNARAAGVATPPAAAAPAGRVGAQAPWPHRPVANVAATTGRGPPPPPPPSPLAKRGLDSPMDARWRRWRRAHLSQ